ncbi:MAG: hypothetical protein C5B49_06745 [Bdellovibrio sp.]|nr:MAG: hypothetical protein C5B49_06745 [Bdellovibrio sp.]
MYPKVQDAPPTKIFHNQSYCELDLIRAIKVLIGAEVLVISNPIRREVQISKLKPNLSQYLRAAQKGHRTTVLDRDVPIAVIGPVEPSMDKVGEGLDLISAVQGPESLHKIAISLVRGKVDSLELLLEERGER